jgi:hypothetical protein
MFEVGDVVVCVDAAGLIKMRKGEVGRITAICAGIREPNETFITLAGRKNDPGKLGYRAWRFRKVTKASAKFTAQMRALKPAPQHANHPTEGAI